MTLLQLACEPVVFETVPRRLLATGEVRGKVAVVTAADLLLVVDDSPTMADEQQRLAQGLTDWVMALRALDPPVDWQVAVMTTSVEERFGPCDAATTDPAATCAARFGATGLQCVDDLCVKSYLTSAGPLRAASGHPSVVRGTTLTAEAAVTLLAGNVSVGLSGARQEQPLRAVRLAWESGALVGFIRPQARLGVIVVTDEDDCSDSSGRLPALELLPDGSTVDRCREQSEQDGDRLDDPDGWTGWLQSVAPGAIVSALAGVDGATGVPSVCLDSSCESACDTVARAAACEQQCNGSLNVSVCLSECRQQCVSFCGARVGARRLARVVRATGGVLASVCEDSYGTALARAARVLGIPEYIDLPSVPADDRAVDFHIERAGATVSCRDGMDYVLDRAVKPVRIVPRVSGPCQLRPGDAWQVRYLTDDM